MPRYDYKCKACEYVFEVMQKMSDEPLSDCPQCEGDLNRLISRNFAISFKGSGFYELCFNIFNTYILIKKIKNF